MTKHSIILTALLLLCCGTAVHAQDDKPTFTADLYGGLYLNNEPAWQLEPSVSWLFHKYLGVAFGLELTSRLNSQTMRGTSDGSYSSRL